MKWWIVLLAFGGLLLLGSTGVFAGGGTGEITCGDEVMRPGDVCEETRPGGVSDTFTYEERVAEGKGIAHNFATKGRWISLGLGLGATAIAVTGMIVTKRRRARRPPTTADRYLQQQAAWQQQQPAQPAHVQQPPQQAYQQPRYQQPHQRYPDFGPRG